MNRLEFLRLSALSTTGLILSPPNLLGANWDLENLFEEDTSCDLDAAIPGWVFNVVMNVGIAAIKKGVYTACVAGLKNPNICKGVEMIAGVILTAAKNEITSGFAQGLKYSIDKKGSSKQVGVQIQTKTMDDALDTTSVIAYSECNSWSYLRDIGKYPQASRIKLKDSYVSSLSKDQLFIMRNEIYARHGYEFKNKGKEYFNAQTWYKQISHKSQNEVYMYDYVFSDTERYNVGLIQKYE
jgi:YARHG domain